MNAFFARLFREVRIFLVLTGTGAFLILLAIVMLSANSEGHAAAENVSFWGYRLLVTAYPLFVFIRILLWLVHHSLSQRRSA